MKNSWNRSHWGARIAFAGMLLLALMASASPSAAQNAPLTCASTDGPISALFLVDSSTSLALTDPEAQRAGGVRDAVSVLRDTAAAQDRTVEISIVTFGVDYQAALPWTPLTPDSAPQIDAAIDGLADQKSAIDTDYAAALGGAQADFADRTAAGNCSLIVLVADGSYAIDARTEATASQFGLTKPYAPDARLDQPGQPAVAVNAGTEALCQAGGTVDSLRSAGVSLATVTIATALRGDDQSFISSLTGSDGQTACGTEAAAGTATYAQTADEARTEIARIVGEYVGAQVVQSQTVPVCQLLACPQGQTTIGVDQGIGRLVTTASFDSPAKSITITSPGGETTTLTPDGDTTAVLEGAEVRADFSTASAVITATATATALPTGDWSMTIVDTAGTGLGTGATATVTTVQQSALGLDITTGPAIAGEPFTVSATIVDVEGQPVDTALLGDTTLTATLTDDATGAATDVVMSAGESGLAGSATLPADFSGSGTLSIDADTTVSGTPIVARGTSAVSSDVVPNAPTTGTRGTTADGDGGSGLLGLLPIALILLSLAAIAAAVLWVRANRRSMFGLDDIRIAELPVVIRADGHIDRLEGNGAARQLYIRGSDFAAVGRGRSRTFAGGRMRFVGNLSLAPNAPVYGIAVGNDPAVGPLGSEEFEDKIGGVLQTDLDGQWLFEIDRNRTADAGDSGELFGRLVVFVKHSLDDSSHHFADLAKQVLAGARSLAQRSDSSERVVRTTPKSGTPIATDEIATEEIATDEADPAPADGSRKSKRWGRSKNKSAHEGPRGKKVADTESELSDFLS